MRKQWRKFVEENQCYWSYGIVPRLVKRLAAAQKAGDQEGVQEALDALATRFATLQVFAVGQHKRVLDQ